MTDDKNKDTKKNHPTGSFDKPQKPKDSGVRWRMRDDDKDVKKDQPAASADKAPKPRDSGVRWRKDKDEDDKDITSQWNKVIQEAAEERKEQLENKPVLEKQMGGGGITPAKLAGVILLGLVIFAGLFFVVKTQFDPSGGAKTMTPRWFDSSPLKSGTVKQWLSGTGDARVATAATFVSTRTRIDSRRDFEPTLRQNAEALVECISEEAVKSKPDMPILELVEPCIQKLKL